MSGILAGPAGPFIAVAVAGLSVGIAVLIRRSLRSTRIHSASAVLVPAAPAAVAAGVAAAGAPETTWVPPLVVAAVSAFAVLARVPELRRVVAAGWARNDVRVGVVVAVLVVCIFWALRDRSPAPTSTKSTEITEARRTAGVAALREVSSPVALTDRGRRVPLFEIPASDLPQEALVGMEAGTVKEWGSTLRLIRTGPADRRSDCHGWVFAEGEAWVVGRDVEVILDDNGYRRVDSPAAGDLAVYRNGPSEITHSGVVFAAGPGGRTLVESKWMWFGVFLHNVDDHPHGGRASFYRSPRSGHRLVFTTPSGAPLAPGALRGAQ